ncbi:hypothetical protein ACO0LO_15580 [Undibacterium sp. TJN25]|uniref:hypothetical protein n=1 Tax=Undibacterium sp. TJN25 TaxID=3413056 RepID=UPI003BEFD0D9
MNTGNQTKPDALQDKNKQRPSSPSSSGGASHDTGGMESGREGQLNGTPVPQRDDELSRQDNSQGTRSNQPSINESEKTGSAI